MQHPSALRLQTYRDAIAIAQRLWLELWRRKSRLLFWLVFPLFVLLLNGLIVADRAQLPLGAALDFAGPATIVGVALFFSCVGGTVAILVTEREQGTLQRLLISPLSGLGYFLGIALAQSAIALAQTVVLLTVALLLGSRYTGSLLLGSGILLLTLIIYGGLGFMLGTQLAQRPEDVNTLVAAFGMPLLLLGGAFFPISIFPDALLQIARFNPIFHMTQALGKVWTGRSLLEIQMHLGVLLGGAIVALFLGSFSYRQLLQRERRL
ncbi:MAG: ABC transporter permease [Cyanobacteria bacterium P01_G01_bin.54]